MRRVSTRRSCRGRRSRRGKTSRTLNDRSPQAKTGEARVSLPRWLRQPRHDGRA